MFYDKAMLGAGYSASPAPADVLQAIRREIDPKPAFDARWSPMASLMPKGTWFDEGLDFKGPEGDAFTRHILGLIAPFEGLKIKRSRAKAENHYTRVRKLLANALRCFYYFDPALVSYFRKAGRLKDKPLWFTGTGMRSATDALAKAGLIDATSGKPGSASTYEATEALLFAALDFGVTETSLTYRLPRERLVRLYETNREGPYADFDTTDETEQSTAMLEAINGFLDQQDIALDLAFAEEAKVVGGWNFKRPKDMPRYHTPELLRTDLYRQFNNGSFEEGGRLYGGWWIMVPAYLRPRITINDQPTVELDYSGCAIRMLYHLRGLECPDDPYRLEEVVAFENQKGFRAGYFRNAIKDLTQARINGTNRNKDMMCDLKGGVTFSPRFTRDEITAMIEAKHEAIADAFGSGAGVRLQRMDSDLTLSIVTRLMEQGVVALPIHDSFIVQECHKGQLFQEMNDRYNDMFGYNPVIK
jgi:hypothetical protein